MRRWSLASAGTAPVALIGGWTIAQARQPAGFDAVRDTISALAAHDATDSWIMTGGLAVLGACHLASAAGLTEAGPASRLLLATGGAATIAVAALPQPNSAHVPAATVAFVALSVWPAAWRAPRRRIGLLASAALLALLGWLAIELDDGDVLGLSERILAGAQALVPLVFAVGASLGLRSVRAPRRP